MERLKGLAVAGSEVTTVMVSRSFGMIRASYKPLDAAKSTLSTFWKYDTFLADEQLPRSSIIAIKTNGNTNFFIIKLSNFVKVLFITFCKNTTYFGNPQRFGGIIYKEALLTQNLPDTFNFNIYNVPFHNNN